MRPSNVMPSPEKGRLLIQQATEKNYKKWLKIRLIIFFVCFYLKRDIDRISCIEFLFSYRMQ